MSSTFLIIFCLILAVLAQYFLSNHDGYIYGLIVPFVFLMIAVIMSILIKGDTLLRVNTFMQWFSPGIVGLGIFVLVKKRKYNKRVNMNKDNEDITNKMQFDDNDIIEVEAEIIEDEERE